MPMLVDKPRVRSLMKIGSDTASTILAAGPWASAAQPGDTVMLAPAAASWDQFRSYAQRGDLFAAAAARLVEAAGA